MGLAAGVAQVNRQVCLIGSAWLCISKLRKQNVPWVEEASIC